MGRLQFQEDDCRRRRNHVLAVMGILRQAALNMVRTLQQNFIPDVSIVLLRDRSGRYPWILAFVLPCPLPGLEPISTRLKQGPCVTILDWVEHRV